MAIELITGRAGRAHVDSSDVRAFNAYVNAGGRYVLHGGGAEIESANDLRILPAEILVDGAHVRITGTGEEVTLENGASSYDRIDIVALHYTSVGSDDSRVESVALEVIKGTPVDTGGDAQDPAMPVPGTSILDGSSEVYVPYVRIKITGLVPGDPEGLLPDRGQMLKDMLADTALGDVPGTLPVSKGGTGATSASAARSNLGLGNLATVNSPLPVANGGTGATSASAARSNLGLGNLATVNSPLPVANGGTGATSGASALNNLGIKKWLLDNVFKVGYVWISYTSTPPSGIVGGTWTPITGRFPYFNAGTSVGGSNTHTLTVNEMPSHTHSLHIGGGGGWNSAILWDGGAAGQDITQHIGYSGGSGKHNNMPAYQTLYAWRRTA